MQEIDVIRAARHFLRQQGLMGDLRLHNGKVYVERDGTEEGVATTLLAAGIPKEAIVLAFYPERKRAH